MSKEAIKAMAAWIAAIADNVKNPIAGISAVLDHAEGHLDDSQIVGVSITQIRKRLETLNEYISELADFSRPATVKPTSVNVKTLATQALEAAHLPLSCVVSVDIPSDFHLNVDLNKMVLALKSLLRNAFEAINVHKPAHVRLAASAQPSGAIVLSVEDNGPGLNSLKVVEALEPFFTTKEAGTGLGLAIVRKYVEAHHGTIVIDKSPLLGGCRVTLTLAGDESRRKETAQ